MVANYKHSFIDIEKGIKNLFQDEVRSSKQTCIELDRRNSEGLKTTIGYLRILELPIVGFDFSF